MAQQEVNIWINGSSGRMGQEIAKLIGTGFATDSHSFSLLGGSSSENPLRSNSWKTSPQLIVDFSLPVGNLALLDHIESHASKGSTPVVLIGTTGLTDDQVKRWEKLSQSHSIPVLIAGNTSIGIILLRNAVQEFAKTLGASDFDVEITESHHRNKVDAPSGTALELANAITTADKQRKITPTPHQGTRGSGAIGIHALRGGNVFGEHSVRFMGSDEEVTLSHRALSRTLFAKGALRLGSWTLAQKPGLYRLNDVQM